MHSTISTRVTVAMYRSFQPVRIMWQQQQRYDAIVVQWRNVHSKHLLVLACRRFILSYAIHKTTPNYSRDGSTSNIRLRIIVSSHINVLRTLPLSVSVSRIRAAY